MVKTKNIQIYLKVITFDFGVIQARRIYGACEFKASAHRWRGKFLVADMPYGEFVFSSLN